MYRTGAAAYLWGAWDALIIVLVIAVSLDYITGVIKAAINSELSSSIGFKGLLGKAVIFIIVALATQIDNVVPATNGAIRAAVIMYYIANEGISIMENAASIGVPMSPILTKWLKKMQEENKEE